MYKSANMYLFVPFFVNGELDIDNLPAAEDGDNSYLEQLDLVSKREFGGLSADLKRRFIADEKFIIADESGNVPCGEKDCKIYLTAYKNFYVAVIAFAGLDCEPTRVIHQAAGGALFVKGAAGEKLPFNEYLSLYFGLKFSCEKRCVNMIGEARCFRQSYGVKCFTSLTAKPKESHLAHMLSCDCYEISGAGESVTNGVFFEKARRNYGGRQFAQIHAAEKSVVCVSDSEKDRLVRESRMIFIIELLSLQICAFNSNYDEVVNGLDKREFTSQIIDSINFRYSRAAKLWDFNNFKYPTSKNIFEALTAEFGIPALKAALSENLSTFEKMTAMESQKQVEQHTKTSNTFFTFFSVLAGFIALSSTVNLFYNAFVRKTVESVAALTVCGVFVVLFGAAAIIAVTRQRKRAEREKAAKCSGADCKHNNKRDKSKR